MPRRSSSTCQTVLKITGYPDTLRLEIKQVRSLLFVEILRPLRELGGVVALDPASGPHAPVWTDDLYSGTTSRQNSPISRKPFREIYDRHPGIAVLRVWINVVLVRRVIEKRGYIYDNRNSLYACS
jgi:hypothetical protein